MIFQEADDDESSRDVNDVIMTDVPDVEIPSVEQTPDSQNSQNEHEISQTYEGAPEMVSAQETHTFSFIESSMNRGSN